MWDCRCGMKVIFSLNPLAGINNVYPCVTGNSHLSWKQSVFCVFCNRNLPSGASGSWPNLSADNKLVKYSLPTVGSWASSIVSLRDSADLCILSSLNTCSWARIRSTPKESELMVFPRDVLKVAEVHCITSIAVDLGLQRSMFLFFPPSFIYFNAKDYLRPGTQIMEILNSWLW